MNTPIQVESSTKRHKCPFNSQWAANVSEYQIKDAAVNAYRHKVMTLSQAAKLAGIEESRIEFLEGMTRGR